MKFFRIFKIVFFLFLFANTNAKSTNIVDSICNYTVDKLKALHLQNKEYERLKQFDKISYNLILDESDWEIVFSNASFHYYRGQTGQGYSMGSKTSDDFLFLMDDYNTKAREASGDTGIYIYSVVYFNFPMYFVQDKIKNFQANGEVPLFTQLEQVGAVKTDWFYKSRALAVNILAKCVEKSLMTNVFKDAVFCFSMTTSSLTNNKGLGSCFMFNMAQPVGLRAIKKYPLIEPSIIASIKSATGTGLTDYHYYMVNAAVSSARCAFQNNCSLDVSTFNQVAKDFYNNNNLTTQGEERIHLINATNLLQSMTPEMAKACIDENNRLVSLADASYATCYRNRPPGSVGGTEAFIEEFIKSIDKLYKKGCSLTRDEILNNGFITCNKLKYTGIDISNRICILKTLMGGSCPDQINVWSYANPNEYCETIAINLITSVPLSQQEEFLKHLRDDGLLPELSSRLNNSTFSALGANNYTAYMNALLEYSHNVYGGILKNGSNVSDICIIKWSERFFSGNDLMAVTQPGNKIKVLHLSTSALFPTPSDFSSANTFGPYDWVGVCVVSNSTLLGVPQGTTVWVPAVYLEWLYNQKSWADFKVASKTVLDAVSILTGIGGIYRAASIYAKIWCATEIFVGTTDLAITNESVRNGLIAALGDDGEKYLKYWDYFSLLVNATSLYSGITDFPGHAQEFRRIYNEKKAIIQGKVSPTEFQNMKKTEEELAKHLDELGEVVGETVRGVTKPDFLNSVNEFKNGANALLGEQAFALWKNEKWVELEELFKNNNINFFNGNNYPPCDGFIRTIQKDLEINFEFDRYGGEVVGGNFVDGGKFVAPKGASFESRALPPDALGKPYKKYRVTKKIPTVIEGEAIPWFNEVGLGTQYKLLYSIDYLKTNGYIIEIP